MSRDPRSNRGGATSQARYEEYEDDYPATFKYYNQDIPARSDTSGRGGDGSRRPGAGDRYGQNAPSNQSSLLDRMKVKSYDAPSRGSLDNESAPRQPSAPTWARKPGAGGASAVRQPMRDERREVAPPPQTASGSSDSTGSTLWGRVMATAGSISINVSVPWTGGSSDGPDTPPGGETRLTKVMKAYYIEKARSPIDLPHWLFEEHERMPTLARPTQRNDGRRGNRYEEPQDEYLSTNAAAGPPRGALRDVYDKAASRGATPIQTSRASPASYASSEQQSLSGTESKATSRLRALRDAKRQGAGAAYSSNRYVEDEYGEDGGRKSLDPGRESDRTQPARVGLPARPGARHY